MSEFTIELRGAEELRRAIAEIPGQVPQYTQAAGSEAAKMLLATEGLQKYPPSTAANVEGRMKAVTFGDGRTALFRMPYYIRGRGTQIPVRGGGWLSLDNSERLGTQWFVQPFGSFGVIIGNRASYAPWVVGDEQGAQMAAIGWRILSEVASGKIDEITAIYQKWIDRLTAKLR